MEERRFPHLCFLISTMSTVQGTCKETMLGCTQAVSGDGLGCQSSGADAPCRFCPSLTLETWEGTWAPQTKLPSGILSEGGTELVS